MKERLAGMLGEEAAKYDLSAALLQRFAHKHELR